MAEADEGARRAFRAWVRVHHPDAGGDPEEFVAGLQRWHRELTAPTVRGGGGEVVAFRTRGGLWLVTRWWRRRTRSGRRVL
ncbi:hypothetical protein [Spirillospora sp. CA-294931]|uniref:hypothetical protein n=1 Tax=Spirillospora sp. CA-294931 TaxID=3240042 RepID=UPI003D8AE1D9